MKTAMRTLALLLFSPLLSLTTAQVTYNNGTFTCTPSTGAVAFCAGASLSNNIIIRCTAGVGQPGNCNDNLAGVPPVGVKSSALCYQSSLTAGDAACSFNGIVYPDAGGSFPIPSNSSSATTTIVGTASASGTGFPTTTTGSNATITISPGTPTPTTTEFAGAAVERAQVGWGILLGLGMAMAVGI